MNYHQSLKSEVEARSRGTLECIEMGKTLLAVRNPAAEEVRSEISIRSLQIFHGSFVSRRREWNLCSLCIIAMKLFCTFFPAFYMSRDTVDDAAFSLK